MGTERIVTKYKVYHGHNIVGDYPTLLQARNRVMELLKSELILTNVVVSNYVIEEYTTTERVGW